MNDMLSHTPPPDGIEFLVTIKEDLEAALLRGVLSKPTAPGA